MTEPHHEPSYYEIALTNRQVVVAFVILLVCLLSAFFSGVWIGRGGAERGGEPVAQLARSAQGTEAAEGHSLEELKFFSDESSPKRGRHGKDGGKDGGGKDSAASPPAESPAQEQPAAPPSAATAAPPRAAPAPAVVPRAIPSRPPADAERPDPDAVVRSRPLPEDEGDTEAGAGASGGTASSGKTGRSPAASTAVGKPVAASPGAGTVVIQVFASADANEANKMKDRLARGGEPAFVSPLTVDGRTMYRVRVGPFASRPRAQKEADRVRKAYKLDTWLTE